MKRSVGAVLALICIACADQTETSGYQPPTDIDQRILALMEEHQAKTVGIGIIRDHELVWTAYYGEQSEGVPAGPDTLFNTASVNKSITAETALRLASKDLIDLDEPISAYYVHPDLEGDPHHELLTPRILLSHQAGFLNWPWLYEDGRLAFVEDPGNGSYNYSGIGFRIFASFLEAKLEKPFPQIVREEVFDPIGMETATNFHNDPWIMEILARPVDEEARYLTDYTLEEDYWSAADDLFVTVEDHAAFLISTMKNEAVSEVLATERIRVQTNMATNDIWRCGEDAVDPCPDPYGHGIGWFVFGDEEGLTVHHGGNDQSEGAIGYYNPATGNGGVVFINSTQGVLMWPKVVDLVDPDQTFQDVFHDVIARFLTPEEGGE
ncbi:MAG: serine hydrolase domain-containing protein [Pseudomonadota bacterium]